MIHCDLTDTEDCVLHDAQEFCANLTVEQDERAREILSLIADEWPLWVMQVLEPSAEPLRFSRVMDHVDGVSQKVVTQTLRRLEGKGFVTRILYPRVPPLVECALTRRGRELLVEVLPLWRWVAMRIGYFDASRARYGASK